MAHMTANDCVYGIGLTPDKEMLTSAQTMPWVVVKRHWGVNARPRWRIGPEEWTYLTSNVAEKLEWCHRRATMLMDEIDWRGAPGHACARHICLRSAIQSGALHCQPTIPQRLVRCQMDPSTTEACHIRIARIDCEHLRHRSPHTHNGIHV